MRLDPAPGIVGEPYNRPAQRGRDDLRSGDRQGLGPAPGRPLALAETPGGSILCATLNGIFEFTGTGWTDINPKTDPDTGIRAMAFAPNGDLLIAGPFEWVSYGPGLQQSTIASGIARLDGTTWRAVDGGITRPVSDFATSRPRSRCWRQRRRPQLERENERLRHRLKQAERALAAYVRAGSVGHSTRRGRRRVYFFAWARSPHSDPRQQESEQFEPQPGTPAPTTAGREAIRVQRSLAQLES